MARYFIEVAYVGTNYSGFQVQDNANSIQSEIEKCLLTFFKQKIELTGSSRTDAGVHALQNFFHFDFDGVFSERCIYNLNAILPNDIVIKSVSEVAADAHCRFGALSRTYQYYLSQKKNPFLLNSAWYYPFKIDIDKLNTCASMILANSNFEAFCKNGTQVNNFKCSIIQSKWFYDAEKDCLVYLVEGNRFLRGMVKALVSTMLLVAKNKMSLEEFSQILENNANRKADFTAPSHGLFLKSVNF